LRSDLLAVTETTREIDYRTVLIAPDGKLRGSRARRLDEALEARRLDGYDQVVLDLRACGAADSVGALALARALDRGQRLLVVAGPGAGPEDVLPPEIAGDRRLRFFAEVADAVRFVRAREGSGLILA
jgi:hypothetical protein